MRRNRPVISASEIGQYAYCPRAWWLARVKGRGSENVEALAFGDDAHRRHGRTVQSASIWQRLAYALIAVSLLTAGLLIVTPLLGI